MTQNKSILFLAKLYHPNIGGVEKHLSEIANILIRKGYKVTILTEKFDIGLSENEINGKIKIVRIPIHKDEKRKKFSIWKWVFLNYKLFLKHDIIHVHDVFYWLYPIYPLLLFKKVYITFHGYEGYPIKWKWIMQRKIAEFLSFGSICVGDFMKKWYFTSPTYVIYGGARLQEKKRSSNGLSAVFFGRLDDQTGIKEYLKAYKMIKKHCPKFKLTIVGEGRLAKKMPKDVKVVGFKQNIEKYIASNRFIFVSRYLSMIEALLQRKEVIAAYDNPVKEDYIKMSPFRNFVYIGKNEKEIAEIVLKRIEKGKDAKRVSNGYNWAKDQTWEKVVKTYLLLWDR